MGACIMAVQIIHSTEEKKKRKKTEAEKRKVQNQNGALTLNREFCRKNTKCELSVQQHQANNTNDMTNTRAFQNGAAWQLYVYCCLNSIPFECQHTLRLPSHLPVVCLALLIRAKVLTRATGKCPRTISAMARTIQSVVQEIAHDLRKSRSQPKHVSAV